MQPTLSLSREAPVSVIHSDATISLPPAFHRSTKWSFAWFNNIHIGCGCVISRTGDLCEITLSYFHNSALDFAFFKLPLCNMYITYTIDQHSKLQPHSWQTWLCLEQYDVLLINICFHLANTSWMMQNLILSRGQFSNLFCFINVLLNHFLDMKLSMDNSYLFFTNKDVVNQLVICKAVLSIKVSRLMFLKLPNGHQRYVYISTWYSKGGLINRHGLNKYLSLSTKNNQARAGIIEVIWVRAPLWSSG